MADRIIRLPSGNAAQKKWASRLLSGPIGMKVKNLQRGTAHAATLGGVGRHVCISYKRYGALLGIAQGIDAHGSHVNTACLKYSAKKWASRLLSGPIGMKVKNLQRGTVHAAALGGVVRHECINCEPYGALLCIAQGFDAQGSHANTACLKYRAKKWASRLLSGPIGMKVKNLQRGTAHAATLGGVGRQVCISYKRYGALLCNVQGSGVHVSHAITA
ncbi:hypothetical protein IMCC20628_00740 [Hoeflea sp. IMCC20628]|nr:hypothetical protein IMCC20628_00740 [Hoeflea sp. IMCC20628]